MNDRATLNYGLRYEYYTPLRERDNLYVVINPTTGLIEDPASRDPFRTQKDNFLPRVSTTYALDRDAKTVLRGGVGLLVGPGQTEDQIQPIESDQVASTISGAFPVNQAALVANFANNPDNRTYQPRAYTPDYNVPERVWQYSVSLQREPPGGFAGTAAYVGSQGRNLFLRSVSNQIVDVHTNRTRRIDSASLRRSGHEDERRARYLQRAAAFGRPPLQRRPHDELAVHLRPQLRQHGRAERGGDVRQQRRRSRRLRLRHRLQHLRRAPHVQRERAFIRFCSAAAASSAATRAS
jgi:hypothetical protein